MHTTGSVLGRLACWTLLAMPAGAQASRAAERIPWRLEAGASDIVVGVLDVDGQELARAERKTSDHVTVQIHVQRSLKGGRGRKPVSFRVFAQREPTEDRFTFAAVRALHGTERLCFLQFEFLVSHRQPAASLLPPTVELEAEVRALCVEHERLLARRLPVPDRELDQRVGENLELALTGPEAQAKAFVALEQLGRPAVPALVQRMRDYRRLPQRFIQLENGPGGFESHRTYAPVFVADALDAILNHLTLESIGPNIVNGDAGPEGRALCARAWTLYAWHEALPPAASQPATRPASR
jgi:hypothetical protein